MTAAGHAKIPGHLIPGEKSYGIIWMFTLRIDLNLVERYHKHACSLQPVLCYWQAEPNVCPRLVVNVMMHVERRFKATKHPSLPTPLSHS